MTLVKTRMTDFLATKLDAFRQINIHLRKFGKITPFLSVCKCLKHSISTKHI